MQQETAFENHLLGYQIERIRQFHSDGTVSSQLYRVKGPTGSAVLGEFAQRAPALRAIVAAELRAVA